MSNSIAPGSSADVNVKVTALTTNPNVPVQYKTIILKKNLVNGVNTLTQEMMSAQNTKYMIKYDYTLGDDITVPENCILEFDGGSVSASGSNDTITGNNTAISAGLVKILNTDVTLAGSWNIAEAYPEWFGAIGSGDESSIIAKTLISFGYNINGNGKTYTINSQINIPYNFIIKNINFICISAGCIAVSGGISRYISGIFENVNIDCQNQNTNDYGILIERVIGGRFINVSISNSTTIGFLLKGTYNALFENCTAYNCRDGLKTELFSNGDVSNINTFNCCHFNHCTNGVNLSFSSKNTANGTRFLNCWFDYNQKGIIINGGYNTRIDEGYFENNSLYHIDLIETGNVDTKIIGCYFGSQGSVHIAANSNKNIISNCFFDPSSGVTPIINDGADLITINNSRSNGTYINDYIGTYENGAINNFSANAINTTNLKICKRNDGNNFSTAVLSDNPDETTKSITYGEMCEIIRDENAIQIKNILGGHTGDLLLLTSTAYRSGTEPTIISGGNISIPSGGIVLGLYDIAVFICTGMNFGTDLKRWYLVSYSNNQ